MAAGVATGLAKATSCTLSVSPRAAWMPAALESALRIAAMSGLAFLSTSTATSMRLTVPAASVRRSTVLLTPFFVVVLFLR